MAEASAAYNPSRWSPKCYFDSESRCSDVKGGWLAGTGRKDEVAHRESCSLFRFIDKAQLAHIWVQNNIFLFWMKQKTFSLCAIHYYYQQQQINDDDDRFWEEQHSQKVSWSSWSPVSLLY